MSDIYTARFNTMIFVLCRHSMFLLVNRDCFPTQRSSIFFSVPNVHQFYSVHLQSDLGLDFKGLTSSIYWYCILIKHTQRDNRRAQSEFTGYWVDHRSSVPSRFQTDCRAWPTKQWTPGVLCLRVKKAGTWICLRPFIDDCIYLTYASNSCRS